MPTIKRTNSENPDFIALTQKLDIVLCEIYGTNQADYEEYNKIVDLSTVILAYIDEVPTACACFKITDEDTVEIKRMFVLPEYRGKGIARLLLAELEKWAAELDYKTSILETGKLQPEAISLYQKAGYQIVPNYGQYEDKELSVCMTKSLIRTKRPTPDHT